MASAKNKQKPNVRSLLDRQPARALLVDFSPPFSSQIGLDFCEALENLFTIACNLGGPSRIPFFSVIALGGYPELLLPLTYVRNNFSRIQSAVAELRNILKDVSISNKTEPCIVKGLVDACDQYRRQAQSMVQSGGVCHQLEIVIVTCKKGTTVQRMLDPVTSTLDLEHLKRIQVVSLYSAFDLPVDEDISVGDSQASLTSQHSSLSALGGILEAISLEADSLCIQNFLNSWLLDSGTDSEHLHIILPPPNAESSNGGKAVRPLVIKCDLHERILNPGQLTVHGQFTVHPDSSTMKMVFPSTSKALGMTIPVYRLRVQSLTPTSSLCDSIVFGMPMIAQATACWKIDWDDLEKNQQAFRALCHELLSKELVILAILEPERGRGDASDAIPFGTFVLIPAPNYTLLVKSVAVQELLLPCQMANPADENQGETLQQIRSSLDKLEIMESYNPLLQTSNLYSYLKQQMKPIGARQSKGSTVSKRKDDSFTGSGVPGPSRKYHASHVIRSGDGRRNVTEQTAHNANPNQHRQFPTSL